MPVETLKTGDQAPDFTAATDDGRIVRLSELRGQRVILYFYPKDDTSGCTAQACAFRDSYPQITEKNAIVIGVSPDDAASHTKFKSKYDLPFMLAVDADHQIAERYGVWGEKNMYGKKYMGIIRSHFVIDERGVITAAHYKVSPAESAAEALQSLS